MAVCDLHERNGAAVARGADLEVLAPGVDGGNEVGPDRLEVSDPGVDHLSDLNGSHKSANS